jgi:hypothetical protein
LNVGLKEELFYAIPPCSSLLTTEAIMAAASGRGMRNEEKQNVVEDYIETRILENKLKEECDKKSETERKEQEKALLSRLVNWSKLSAGGREKTGKTSTCNGNKKDHDDFSSTSGNPSKLR